MKRSSWAHGADAAQLRDFAAALGSLRATLKNATDFADPWAQFHDELMTYEEATTEAELADDPQITAMLSAIGAKVTGHAHEPQTKRFLHLRDHRFWHGMCHLGPRSVVFFYFQDDDVGLAGFTRSLLDSSIDLVRFSVLLVPPGFMPTRTRGQA
jgi:hypothetical protein